MKLRHSIVLNGRETKEVSWYVIYPFFLVHMFMFGLSGFSMAYFSGTPFLFLFFHGGIAITVYVFFYIYIFGVDEVKWMFINAALSLAAMYTQTDWILAIFGRDISRYPFHRHIIPFIYFTLYTFLLRQAFIDLFDAREDDYKRKIAENSFMGTSILLSLISFFDR